MWLSDISVKRPVLATVVNLLLVVFGLFALLNITVREYPDIDPPIVSVRTNYPGASAAVVETKITQVLEDRIAGIEGIRSISSSSTDGDSNINVEFSLARDVEDAANDVRDRVSRALGNLPEEADPPEVSKADTDASPIIWLTLSSAGMTELELSDYADRYLADRLGAIDGVSQVRVGGQRLPAMRIWLDRQALAARRLTVLDVEDALRSQNVERPAGRLESSTRELTLRTARPFQDAADFAKLVVATGEDGYPIRLGEVAKVEIAAAEHRDLFRANGAPTVGLGVIKQSKANTLAVADAVKAELAQIRTSLPEGMDLSVNSDYSVFIEASLDEVLFTLGFCGALVVLVIYLFLGTWRATLIPALAVPISLIAAFIFLYAFGFSLNLLTMLALVLAIGLVVDDTIVMVENIHRRLELGEPPLLAAYNGAREVGFAILATTLVLMAVFAPLAFLQGNVGKLFGEFALSMAAAVGCSMVVSLTLSPVLCALLLKRDAESGSRFSAFVTRRMDALSARYRGALVRLVHRRGIAVATLLAMLAGSVLLFRVLPVEFAPPEDRGQFFISMTGPEGASYDYSVRYMSLIEEALLQRLGDGEIRRFIIRVPGFGGSDAVNSGTVLVTLTDWSERDRSSTEIANELGDELRDLPGVRTVVSERSGFVRGINQKVQVALGGSSYEELAAWRDQLFARIARDDPGLIRLDSNYKETKPRLDVEVDLNRAADLGVSLQSIGRTLEILLGGLRATTYIDRGQEYDVMLQARDRDRVTPSDLTNIHVRAGGGELVPLSNLIRTREGAASASYNRYNRLRSITLSAGLAPGYTLGEALAYLERIVAEELPGHARLSFLGESRELKESSQALYVTFGLALLIVFLVLAAQFESFVHPLVIMSTVPLAVFGALAGLGVFGFSLNIYSQIGMIMLIGLAAKNGILIVEFANQRRDAGLPFDEALIEASQVRLRPILMTSVATVTGVLPLVFAHGAGSEAREVLGQVVFWGVLFATALTLFLVPAFYALFARRTKSPGHTAQRLAQEAGQQTAFSK